MANGIPEQTAQDIYDEIEDFAQYAFNKAHAVAYAIVAYQTAWFKCHYTREYMAALLTSVLDSSEKVAEYIAECKDCGIALLPPDINESEADFTVSGDNIRFGLVAVKGVGRGFINDVLAERQRGGPFTSFPDFCQRMFDADLNKRVLESLIKCGAFDSMGVRRSQLLRAYEPLVDSIAQNKRKNLEGQFDLFGGGGRGADRPGAAAEAHPGVHPPGADGHGEGDHRPLPHRPPHGRVPGAGQQCQAAPIGAILADFAQEGGPTTYRDEQRVTLAGVVSSARTKTTRNNTLMAYVTLEDDTGSMEMLVFARVLGESGPYLKESVPVLAEGRISVRDEKAPQLMCDRVRPLEHGRAAGPPAEAGRRAEGFTSAYPAWTTPAGRRSG